jgi:hypothetical protein
VPLTPGDGIGGVEGGWDGERASGGPSIDVQRDGAAAIRGVEEAGGVEGRRERPGR